MLPPLSLPGVVAACARLSAQRLILADHFRNGIQTTIRLNIRDEDMRLGLGEKMEQDDVQSEGEVQEGGTKERGEGEVKIGEEMVWSGEEEGTGEDIEDSEEEGEEDIEDSEEGGGEENVEKGNFEEDEMTWRRRCDHK